MNSWNDGTIEIRRLSGAVRVLVGREAAPPEAAAGTAVEREWARRRLANPRLYNGPILSVVSVDAERAEVRCRRESYQRLAVQPRVPTGVRLLSVTAVATAKDREGREHVLLGRRAAGVRVYGGMWELGPSGGVGPPPGPVEVLTARDLAENLADEIAEEIGVEVEGLEGRVECLARDTAACSDDVVMRVDLGALEEARRATRPASWEYTEVRWTPVEEIGALDAREGGEIIRASRGIFRALGWAE